MSESQAFFILSVLCDRLLPGYYSTTMYGTLLDQKVFESLVEKTMPVLWDHLVRSDVQLSVVSLPWFLSLYINSMPLVFAFRVLDVFFLEGPKVLFQIGLAILRINGEELLDVSDDGTFISILKSYFSCLDESAHPRSENPKLRAITRFQELMVVAFKEFSGITHSTIADERAKHKDAVLDNIESFAKRTSIRNLGPESKKLSLDDLGGVYDRFYEVLYDRQQRIKKIEEEKRRQERESRKAASRYSTIFASPDTEVGRVGLGPTPTQMDYDAFREFLAATSRWAVADSPGPSRKESTSDSLRSTYSGNSMRGRNKSSDLLRFQDPADHEFMHRLFRKWDTDNTGTVSLQDITNGLARIKGTRDIMNTINYFFELYDDSGTGQVDREGILRMSEALLFLSRRGFDGTVVSSDATDVDVPPSAYEKEHGAKAKMNAEEKFLGSVSDFIRRCFEYADPSHPQQQNEVGTTEVEEKVGAFSIGGDDDGEGDLLDMNSDSKGSTENTGKSTTSTDPSSENAIPAKQVSHSANAALDPAHPLHITLPTFRMVILADELLEQFFDTFFPQSFRLSDIPEPASASRSTLSTNLTTFANIGANRRVSGSPASAAGATVAGASGGIVPPGQRGIRGVLDNIVSDGMRMAAEVRKKMDEAQREMEKNALGNRADDDEEDDEEDGSDGQKRDLPTAGSSSKARDADLDLLEGAEVVSLRPKDDGGAPGQDNNSDNNNTQENSLSQPSSTTGVQDTRRVSDTSSVNKVVEFES